MIAITGQDMANNAVNRLSRFNPYPGYADGGTVQKPATPFTLRSIYNSVVNAVTPTPPSPEQLQRNADMAKYRADAAAERTATAAKPVASAPAPAGNGTAIGNYSGNTSLQGREQKAMADAGLKRGGVIKGPVGQMQRMAMAAPQTKTMPAPMVKPPRTAPTQDSGQQDDMAGGPPGYKGGGAIRRMATMAQKKKADVGAKIQGPGTPTSDSIPAKVVNTGEPIKVSTNERIVSKKQGVALEKEAKSQGYKSLDHKLESMTGKPVGPTIKYVGGKPVRHAASGLDPSLDQGMYSATNLIPGAGIAPPGAMYLGYHSPVPNNGPSMFRPGDIGNRAGPIMGSSSDKAGYSKGGAIRRMAMCADGGVMRPGMRGFDDGGTVEPYRPSKDSQAYNVAATTEDKLGFLPGESIADRGKRNLVGAIRSIALGAPPEVQPVVKYSGPVIGSMNDPVGPSAPVTTVPVPSAGSTPAPAKPVSQPMVPAAMAPAATAPAAIAPTSTGAAARLMGTQGVDVGNGTTRFDIAGKSPLFTNMTDAPGMASNQALMNRGDVTSQNLGALDGLMDRQNIQSVAAAKMAQYNNEVAGANRVNASQPYDPDAGVQALNDPRSPQAIAIHNLGVTGRGIPVSPQNQKGIEAIINDALSSGPSMHKTELENATKLRGQDVDMRQQDVVAQHNNAADRLAQQKFGVESNTSAAELQSKQHMLDLQKQLADATASGDQDKVDGIKQQIEAASPGYNRQPIPRATPFGGGSQQNADGTITHFPTAIYDTKSGQVIMPPAPQAAAVPTVPTPSNRAEYNKLPKGATYVAPDGKSYVKG